MEDDFSSTEKLRRKDKLLKQALTDKQHLVAEILKMPREIFDTDLASELAFKK